MQHLEASPATSASPAKQARCSGRHPRWSLACNEMNRINAIFNLTPSGRKLEALHERKAHMPRGYLPEMNCTHLHTLQDQQIPCLEILLIHRAQPGDQTAKPAASTFAPASILGICEAGSVPDTFRSKVSSSSTLQWYRPDSRLVGCRPPTVGL